MPTASLSLSTARTLHLAAQQLQNPLKRQAKPDDLLSAIKKMALLQIDTISVVARSPYLVLFSRLGNYPSEWLEEALLARKIFEYWAHEACFIPVEDYRLLRHRMLNPQNMGWKFNQAWFDKHESDIKDLLDHIAEKGPVRSADFTLDKRGSTGWWDWKPHKRHLETLFTSGELMVAERRNFHRVYDLRSNILPHWDDATQTLSQEHAEFDMLCRSAQALGIFRIEWLADYYRLKRVNSKKLTAQLLDLGLITPVEVAGFSSPLYVHQSLHRLLAEAEAGKITSTVTTLLSPFDPVVWDRRRALELFNFDYRIECYTPEAKRQYGYFTLPILNRGEIIGRTDAKMHRKQGILEIKSLHLEPGVNIGPRRVKDITEAISRFARWQGATQVTLGNIPQMLKTFWEEGWSLLP
ncbi:winged helix-turn-helix domain-containing protein [Rouxiella badensis]|uniref:winged helix-turn-helix domain-containing protein n=1 Tax=Rouxiella badensis TaxID=1646377 RepID=UPI001B71879A|nr:winged helix-turn-helix domain-containing protein [Rouxiella badensis]MCC3745820.1 winged helix-turn-helix domain-containing protein [Rouxiella badensis]WAT07068.1 winged helix-turn-helix domain-containing protein [Rouxiella badensis]